MKLTNVNKLFLKGFAVCVAMAFVSCGGGKSELGIGYEDFVIQVDSVAMPQWASLGDKVTIAFFGTVGPDDSYSFDHLNVVSDSTALNIMLIGRHNLTKNNPRKEPVTLHNCHYSFKLKDAAHSTVRVMNPGYERVIEKKLEIR